MFAKVAISCILPDSGDCQVRINLVVAFVEMSGDRGAVRETYPPMVFSESLVECSVGLSNVEYVATFARDSIHHIGR